MAVPKIFAYSSLITLLLSLGNLFLIIHAINNNATTQKTKGFSFRLIHRDSPESPLYRSNLTKAMRRKEYIQMTKLRHNSLVISVKTNKTLNPNEDIEPIIRPPIIIQQFIYLVEVDIGTFDGKPDSKTIHLGLDTGSDLTWTQCEGCVNCFHQVDPYYPASQSHSYKPVPCTQCASTAECAENVCKETRMYGDGSVVKAIMATESFVFRSQNDGLEIDGILFGCGFDMQNFIQGQDSNNMFSGYLGMGYGLYSFPEQAKILVNGKFSYCLQPEEEGLPPMYLRFGDDVIQPPAEVYTTPMFKRGDREGHHYLNLRGIRVDDEDLELPPGVFDILSDGTGGCIIDTGTPTSRITSVAYNIFKDAVARNIESANKNVERFQSHTSGLDLCYKRVREPETVNLPYITWVFAEAADFFMTSDLTFDTFMEDGFPIVCLLFLESNKAVGGLTILGSEQQIDHRIIYDLTNGQLHFGPEDCSNGA